MPTTTVPSSVTFNTFSKLTPEATIDVLKGAIQTCQKVAAIQLFSKLSLVNCMSVYWASSGDQYIDSMSLRLHASCCSVPFSTLVKDSSRLALLLGLIS